MLAQRLCLLLSGKHALSKWSLFVFALSELYVILCTQLVDCVSSDCKKGGCPNKAMQWVMDNKGQPLESSNPYKNINGVSTPGSCKARNGALTISGVKTFGTQAGTTTSLTTQQLLQVTKLCLMQFCMCFTKLYVFCLC